MHLVVDKDHSIAYEVNGYARRLFNYFFVPLLNLLPKSSKRIIQKSHLSVHEVIKNATTHSALEMLYKKGNTNSKSNLFRSVMLRIWFGTTNSKAVRNRLQLVRRELRIAISKCLDQKTQISILSIASGSARAVIESLTTINIPKHCKIDVVFLDKNRHALEYSKDLINKTDLTTKTQLNFVWINNTAGTYVRSIHMPTFDIIEMVGLLDYFNDHDAKKLFSDISRILNIGGTFITANIDSNPERKFITHTIGWKMIYRSAEQLGALLRESGFADDLIKLYYEPLRVHTVAVASKL